jgi:HEAT repeat protein
MLQDPAAEALVKARAAMILGELKATAAVPDLIAALNDPSPEVRWRAVTALGEIRDPQAIPGVMEILRDPDPTTARAAHDALVALDARDRIPALREWLQGSGSSSARALAAEGLRLLAGRDAVEPLVAALRDPDEEVAKAAAAALGALGDSRATEPLGRVVADGSAAPWLRYEAVKALEALGDVAGASALQIALADPDPALRRLAARALGTLRNPATGPALVAALKDTAPEVREAAALAVGTLKTPDGPEALVRLLHDPHAEVRAAAADGLVKYEGAAIPALERAVGHADGELRARVEEIRKRIGK